MIVRCQAGERLPGHYVDCVMFQLGDIAELLKFMVVHFVIFHCVLFLGSCSSTLQRYVVKAEDVTLMPFNEIRRVSAPKRGQQNETRFIFLFQSDVDN